MSYASIRRRRRDVGSSLPNGSDGGVVIATGASFFSTRNDAGVPAHISMEDQVLKALDPAQVANWSYVNSAAISRDWDQGYAVRATEIQPFVSASKLNIFLIDGDGFSVNDLNNLGTSPDNILTKWRRHVTWVRGLGGTQLIVSYLLRSYPQNIGAGLNTWNSTYLDYMMGIILANPSQYGDLFVNPLNYPRTTLRNPDGGSLVPNRLNGALKGTSSIYSSWREGFISGIGFFVHPMSTGIVDQEAQGWQVVKADARGSGVPVLHPDEFRCRLQDGTVFVVNDSNGFSVPLGTRSQRIELLAFRNGVDITSRYPPALKAESDTPEHEILGNFVNIFSADSVNAHRFYVPDFVSATPTQNICTIDAVSGSGIILGCYGGGLYKEIPVTFTGAINIQERWIRDLLWEGEWHTGTYPTLTLAQARARVSFFFEPRIGLVSSGSGPELFTSLDDIRGSSFARLVVISGAPQILRTTEAGRSMVKIYCPTASDIVELETASTMRFDQDHGLFAIVDFSAGAGGKLTMRNGTLEHGLVGGTTNLQMLQASGVAIDFAPAILRVSASGNSKRGFYLRHIGSAGSINEFMQINGVTNQSNGFVSGSYGSAGSKLRFQGPGTLEKVMGIPGQLVSQAISRTTALENYYNVRTSA